jgi:hypothetical protein
MCGSFIFLQAPFTSWIIYIGSDVYTNVCKYEKLRKLELASGITFEFGSLGYEARTTITLRSVSQNNRNQPRVTKASIKEPSVGTMGKFSSVEFNKAC